MKGFIAPLRGVCQFVPAASAVGTKSRRARDHLEGVAVASDVARDDHNFSVWGFIKGFGKLLIGLLLLLQGLVGLIVLLFIATIAIATMGAGNKSGPNLQVPADSALLINPQGALVEQAEAADPFAAFGEYYGAQQDFQVEVGQLVETIRWAKDDKRIKSIVLDLGALGISQYDSSKMNDVAAELDAFKAAGKEIVAVGDFYSQEQYYLAARADKILLNDYGNVVMYGYGSYGVFFKSFLDKMKVTAHVFRVGTFKAAVEPILRDDMSPEAKQANAAYLSVLWDAYAAGVEKARRLPAGSVKAYSNGFGALLNANGGDLALAAKTAKLVDELKPRREQIEFLVEKFGKSDDEDEPFKNVNFKEYHAAVAHSKRREMSAHDKKQPDIAVVTAAGTIVDGEADDGEAAGGDTIASYLRRAREDDDVKAVVLRVDTPGGSAFASEVIRQEVLALKKAGKPVVVSMGSLATSGGYWISAPADRIYAAPTTLTGSIGIFAYFPTFEKLASEWGVNVDGVGTTSLSSLMATGIGPLQPDAADIFQRSTEHGYNRFLAVVGEGRKLDSAYVDSIGQGRVWIAGAAKERKLVDRFGGLDDAVKGAAELAKLEEGAYDVKQFEGEVDGFASLFGSTSVSVAKFVGLDDDLARLRTSPFGKAAEQAAGVVAFTSSFNDPNGLYARCVVCEN